MKKVYPDYKKTGVAWIEESLKGRQKKIYEDYMDLLRSSITSRAIEDYRIYFLQFIDIIEKPLDKLKSEDFIKVWAVINQDPTRTIFTKNKIKNTIKRFGRWYYKTDFEIRDTLETLKAKNQLVNEEKLNKSTLLTEKQILRLIKSCKNWKERAMFILAYESAARPKELRLAKWKQVDWDSKTINLFSTKTSKAREVPLNESITHLKRWFQEWEFENPKEEDYIFPSPFDRTKPVIDWTWRNYFNQIARRANIKLNPYLLRHSRITELREKGIDEADRKLFAGHSRNSRMQSVYTHISSKGMIKNIISKVYHVEELTPSDVSKYKKALLINLELLQAHREGASINKIQKLEEQAFKILTTL